MSLAPYVRILGRGPARSRPLTRVEACEALSIIVSGEARPEALGALLMLMRYRGETADEIAGFVDALSTQTQAWHSVSAALDWPSYAAGRTRGTPLFLLSAKLVAQAGYPVLLHGWNSHQGAHASVRDALPTLDIPVCETPETAETALRTSGIAYAPLAAVSPALLELIRLRDVFGLRSCMNTVARMLNPSHAPAAVQGVFHPSYRDLQSDAAALLGRYNLRIIKGGGGEFERHPGKTVTAFGLLQGQKTEAEVAPLSEDIRRMFDRDLPPVDPADLWQGRIKDDFALAVVTGTAGLALWTLGACADADEGDAMARTLWRQRDRQSAA